MKTSRYTEAQIIAILRQAEGGVPIAELCREHGMINAPCVSVVVGRSIFPLFLRWAG